MTVACKIRCTVADISSQNIVVKYVDKNQVNDYEWIFLNTDVGYYNYASKNKNFSQLQVTVIK